ncbi:unnamed protein product [Vitrella brassicaformis CCMP3155]|uniref:F-box domain-containing protein n=3 Tax=Vitrella brassicaformis TaxID=1169539 RepID=A0A0G4FQF6_VITBC|nr:unnamed protein product [Vitrella brassicaformis CCMP3155]|eukprot:CEM16669.1 unnamed protein product [Vitrella brassicaformis CCMP3155]
MASGKGCVSLRRHPPNIPSSRSAASDRECQRRALSYRNLLKPPASRVSRGAAHSNDGCGPCRFERASGPAPPRRFRPAIVPADGSCNGGSVSEHRNMLEDLPEDIMCSVFVYLDAQDMDRLGRSSCFLFDEARRCSERRFQELFGAMGLPTYLRNSRSHLFRLLQFAQGTANAPAVLQTIAWAAAFGYPRYIRHWLSQWRGTFPSRRSTEVPNARAADGTPALYLATQSKKYDIMALLLEAGACPNAPLSNGNTSLFVAAKHLDLQAADILMQAGASPIVENRVRQSVFMAVIQVAREAPNPDTVHSAVAFIRIIARGLDTASKSSRSALKALLAACEARLPAIVETLLDAGVGMPASQQRHTAAHSARSRPQSAHAGSVAATQRRISLRNGGNDPVDMLLGMTLPDPSWVDRFETSMSMSPTATPASPSARPLSAAGSVVGGSGGDGDQLPCPLLVACQNGNREIVQLLLEKGGAQADVNSTLASGKTPLYIAAEMGDDKMIAMLLIHGAKLSSTTCTGRSALFAAVQGGHEKAVKSLLKFADVPDIIRPTPNGDSPFSLAERRGKAPMLVDMLDCYLRQIRKRAQLRDMGLSDDECPEVFDAYLTALCLKMGLIGRSKAKDLMQGRHRGVSRSPCAAAKRAQTPFRVSQSPISARAGDPSAPPLWMTPEEEERWRQFTPPVDMRGFRPSQTRPRSFHIRAQPKAYHTDVEPQQEKAIPVDQSAPLSGGGRGASGTEGAAENKTDCVSRNPEPFSSLNAFQERKGTSPTIQRWKEGGATLMADDHKEDTADDGFEYKPKRELKWQSASSAKIKSRELLQSIQQTYEGQLGGASEAEGKQAINKPERTDDVFAKSPPPPRSSPATPLTSDLPAPGWIEHKNRRSMVSAPVEEKKDFLRCRQGSGGSMGGDMTLLERPRPSGHPTLPSEFLLSELNCA